MLSAVLLGDHLVRRGLVTHGIGDGHFGRLVVVVVDLLLVFGFGMNEHLADDDEIFRLVLGDHPVGDGVGDRLGDRRLGGTEHQSGLVHPFDRDLGDHDRGGFDGDVGREDGEQIAVPLALPRQGVGERTADGSAFGPDQQIDVSNLVAITRERLSDMHQMRHTTVLPYPSCARPLCSGGLFGSYKIARLMSPTVAFWVRTMHTQSATVGNKQHL